MHRMLRMRGRHHQLLILFIRNDSCPRRHGKAIHRQGRQERQVGQRLLSRCPPWRSWRQTPLSRFVSATGSVLCRLFAACQLSHSWIPRMRRIAESVSLDIPPILFILVWRRSSIMGESITSTDGGRLDDSTKNQHYSVRWNMPRKVQSTDVFADEGFRLRVMRIRDGSHGKRVSVSLHSHEFHELYGTESVLK